ncbi:MAG: DUF3990 domain-containing protein [Mobilitalea sp.]
MTLYHGTLDRYGFDIWKNGINLNKSKPYLDFGKGFYTTKDKDLAYRTAITRANSNNKFNNKFALPSIVKMKIDDSLFQQFIIKEFIQSDDEWAKFIINNRCTKEYLEDMNICNHNHNSEYDIVIGGTADGIVSNIAFEIMNNINTIHEGIHKLFLTKEGKDYGQQISFHSYKVIPCIKIIDCAIIRL